MNKLNFLRESLRNIRTTGSVVRSSRFLTKAMLRHVDFEKNRVLIELGAGDGVFTHALLDQMRSDAQLLCFEINPAFCEILRNTIQDNRFHLIEDSAENIRLHLDRLSLQEADCIVSALPYVAFPDDLTERIIQSARNALREGGLYIQFHYSTPIRHTYQRIFGNVKLHFVPLNFPPAFVMVSEKKE